MELLFTSLIKFAGAYPGFEKEWAAVVKMTSMLDGLGGGGAGAVRPPTAEIKICCIQSHI